LGWFEEVETDGDGVGAERAPFAGFSAGAEVFGVVFAADDEAGAVGGGAGLDDAAEDGRLPGGAENTVLGEDRAGGFHGLPAGEIGEKFFGQDDVSHAAARMRERGQSST
jgi:hypothetical protein